MARAHFSRSGFAWRPLDRLGRGQVQRARTSALVAVPSYRPPTDDA